MTRTHGPTGWSEQVARLRGAAAVCGVREHDVSSPQGAQVATVRGWFDSEPLALTTRCLGVTSTPWVELRLPAPGASVALSVRPEQVGEWVDKALGMTLDQRVGDRAFDARFVVEAAPAALASALLPPDARAALLALPGGDQGPVVCVDAGEVVLSFPGLPDPSTLALALRAARALRDAVGAVREELHGAGALTPFRRSEGGLTVDAAQRAQALASLARARLRGSAALATAFVVSAGLLLGALLEGRLQ